MPWEWTHAQEAYDAARRNLEKKDDEWLAIVLTEWRVDQKFKEEEPKIGDFDVERAWVNCMARDDIIDAIWDKMAEQRTCTNGGFEAWACPFGCGVHLISFRYQPESAT